MPLTTLLVPIDFSDVTPDVMAFAATIAQAYRSRVVLLHVSEPEPDFVGFDPGPASVRDSVARDVHHGHRELEACKASLVDAGVETLALHIQGPTAEKILSEAREHQAGLIVLGSHGHGALYHLLAGGVATAVLKEAACPVTIVPARRKSAAAAGPAQ